MPIEIRELIIKATVAQADEEEATAEASSAMNTEDDCDTEPSAMEAAVTEILKRKNER